MIKFQVRTLAFHGFKEIADHRWGFPADHHHRYTATAFQEAADEWNALELGVHISGTTNKAEANFLVKYYKPKTNRRVLASAFFPNRVEDVLVYDFTLVDPFWRGVLKNTFLHEIGHVLGLRHEFANDPDPENLGHPRESKAILIGSINPHSVMSYDKVNNINELNIKDTKTFYELPNRLKVGAATTIAYRPRPSSTTLAWRFQLVGRAKSHALCSWSRQRRAGGAAATSRHLSFLCAKIVHSEDSVSEPT